LFEGLRGSPAVRVSITLLVLFVGDGRGAVDFFDSLLKRLNLESMSREDEVGGKQKEFVFSKIEVILNDLFSRFGGCLD
jgi:hypothetical protein